MSEEVINEEQNLQEKQTEELVAFEDDMDRKALIEALLFACGEPLGTETICQVTRLDEDTVKNLLSQIQQRLSNDGSGLELVVVAGKYQFRTRSVFAPYIRELKAGGPRKLSAPALETLSIVAYRQPIVKSDIEKIRGVDATPTIKTLLERNLIKIVGHQATVGQPALYGTTDDFLKLFSLSSLSELPTLRDLNELESDPGETEAEMETEADQSASEEMTENQAAQ